MRRQLCVPQWDSLQGWHKKNLHVHISFSVNLSETRPKLL